MSHTPLDFDDHARASVYRAIALRRDIRTFRRDPLPDEVLERILQAAHQAGSVGFMQPWNFLVVRDHGKREELLEHFREVNARASEHYRDDRRERYLSLKLQGILDAPLNMLVTCDTTRGGKHVLGRSTMPQMDVYSTCLAVQNLWLAARVEGVGVGWISILEPSFVREAFGIPEHVEPVAYLALGYPTEFPETALLERVGWREREDLRSLIFEERWGEPSRSVFAGPGVAAAEASESDEDLEANTAPNVAARAAERLDRLTKPPGSLGRLEDLALRLCDVQGREFPTVARRALLLMAGDHGVVEEGVSAYRPELTARMVYQFIAGGAAVNALARRTGLQVVVADLGVNHDFESATGLVDAKVRRGTRNLAVEPALTREEAQLAIQRGRELVQGLGSLDVLALGEMGIGNSTAASALTCALLDLSAAEVVGRGTGVGNKTLEHKRAVVERALERHAAGRTDETTQEVRAMDALASLGGLELAGLVGAILEASTRRTLVVLDGFIVGAAALVAARISPSVTRCLVAGHCSTEPGHRAVLEELQLQPLLDLDLRLGEGSGAVLALDLVDAAARMIGDMVTFEEAGIEDPVRPGGRD